MLPWRLGSLLITFAAYILDRCLPIALQKKRCFATLFLSLGFLFQGVRLNTSGFKASRLQGFKAFGFEVLHAQNRGGFLFFQHIQFVGYAIPFGRLCHGWFDFSEIGPMFCQLSVELDKNPLLADQFVFLNNRLRGTFRHTQSTIDALDRVDHHKIWPFMERIGGAHRHTVGVFTLNTVIGDDKSHNSSLFLISRFAHAKCTQKSRIAMILRCRENSTQAVRCSRFAV